MDGFEWWLVVMGLLVGFILGHLLYPTIVGYLYCTPWGVA